jgi:4-hydroxy-3-methylbut-2-enyl diphosphate reductase
MRVVLADSYGMCFGVRDAIEMALTAHRPQELTVLGELVHNAEVLRRLRAAGLRIAPSLHAPADTPRVMITAHGASNAAIADLRARGLEVEEATCPLVRHAHRMLERLVARGYFPVVIGKRDHVEVLGLVGDLDEYEVIENAGEIGRLAGRARLGIVSQTTQPLEHVQALVEQIRSTVPDAELRFVDTVCAPTKERQQAARRLASECGVVIVIGGRSSNNTRQLVRTCEAEGARAYQVESAQDLRTDWLLDTDAVGLTAGTSTPDEVIAEVYQALLRFAGREMPLAA